MLKICMEERATTNCSWIVVEKLLENLKATFMEVKINLEPSGIFLFIRILKRWFVETGLKSYRPLLKSIRGDEKDPCEFRKAVQDSYWSWVEKGWTWIKNNFKVFAIAIKSCDKFLVFSSGLVANPFWWHWKTSLYPFDGGEEQKPPFLRSNNC